MKKWPALALTAGLLTTALTATEATAADPAPTNVQISWKDQTFQYVHVTWAEESPQPNKVVLRTPGQPDQFLVVYTPADGPNEVDLRTYRVRDYGGQHGVLEIGVAAATAEAETSPVAVSKPFDTIGPGEPELASFAMSGTSTLSVKWRAGAPPQSDTTPNDPLDRTAPVTFTPSLDRSGGTAPVLLTKPGPATELTFTGPTPPFSFGLLAENEWGGFGRGGVVQAASSALTAKIPTWTVDGALAVINGTFAFDAGVDRSVVLQARNSVGSPWYVVGSQTVHSNKYSFNIMSPGTRQYRVALPNTTLENDAWFGGYSPAVTMTTQLNPSAARFATSTINRGGTAEAQVWISPWIDGKAILQRWNGKTWTTVGPITVKGGFGRGYVRSTAPGRVAYRYYVPANTYHGFWFAAAYSQTFVLTTR